MVLWYNIIQHCYGVLIWLIKLITLWNILYSTFSCGTQRCLKDSEKQNLEYKYNKNTSILSSIPWQATKMVSIFENFIYDIYYLCLSFVSRVIYWMLNQHLIHFFYKSNKFGSKVTGWWQSLIHTYLLSIFTLSSVIWIIENIKENIIVVSLNEFDYFSIVKSSIIFIFLLTPCCSIT